MGMTKSGFSSAVRGIVVGAAFAAAAAIGCGDYGNNNRAYSGAGGQTSCVIAGPTAGAVGTMGGSGGAGGARTDGGADANGMTVACTGTGGIGGARTNGTGGANNTGVNPNTGRPY